MPLDLGHEVFRKPQVIEGLLKGLGDLVRLAAVSREALSGAQETALSGFGVFFRGSLAWGHAEILRSVGHLVWLKYTQAHVL